MDVTLTLVLVVLAAVAGAGGMWFVLHRFLGRRTFQERIVTQHITERVRSVGRLVGLEVCAKEIATATSGWAWLPPILLSQARLAMIFHFRKQYSVDLSRLGGESVRDLGSSRVRITLPPLESTLSLTDVIPYDIQAMKVLGLLDVAPMTADRQRDLMRKAQQQASELYESNDDPYRGQARASIERHLAALLDMVGVRAEIEWNEERSAPPVTKIRSRDVLAKVG